MSEQFDIHRNLRARSPADPPYLVNLQSDRLSSLPTIIVAPLWPEMEVGSGLSFTVVIGRRAYFVAVAELTSIRHALLGPVVDNLRMERDRFVRALDLLFTGI